MDASKGAQERITGFWNAVAPDYEAHPGNVPEPDSAEYAAWVTALITMLPPTPADVLDIGTGTGFVALIAASLGHRVTGIDLSQEMLSEARSNARRRGVEAQFVLLDAVTPSLPAASFDAIISRHFIWTLREPGTALANWRRLLRPGGRVVAIDSFWFDSAESDAEIEGAGLFEGYYTRETRASLPTMGFKTVEPVIELFESAGYTSLAVSELAEVHRLAKDPPSSAPWYVIVGRRP